MKIPFAIVAILLLLSIVAIAGCVNPLDPCENKFTDCNHSCGEGLLSSLCKQGCTSDYNECEKP